MEKSTGSVSPTDPLKGYKKLLDLYESQTMKSTSINHPLPTPPQQLHDTFYPLHRKPSPSVLLPPIGVKLQEKEDTQLPPLVAPLNLLSAERSRDDAFESYERGESSTSPKDAVFGLDFALFSPGNLDRMAREQTAEAKEMMRSFDRHTPSVDHTTTKSKSQSPEEPKSEDFRRRPTGYDVWAARYPVVTPEQHYNNNPVAYAQFLAAERKAIKNSIKRENDRREESKQNDSKEGPKGATAAPKQRTTKRQRVEEHQESSLPTARPLARSPSVAPLTLSTLRETSIDREKEPIMRTLKPRVILTPPKKLVDSTPAGITKSKSSRKESPVKTVKKANKSKPGKPSKPIKPSKAGCITNHMTAIKLALNDRHPNAGKIRSKNAPDLFEDSYIPPINLDNKSLKVPEREMPTKDLNVHDPFYNHLHPLERNLAERIRATPSEYITMKRRYFLGLAEWWRLGQPTFSASHAQAFCNQDGNNTSYMYRAFEEWGWHNRNLWTSDILESIKPLTSCQKASSKDNLNLSTDLKDPALQSPLKDSTPLSS